MSTKARGRKEEGVTVKEIVEVYLVVLGYDGLYTEDCGCLIADLMPCDGEGPECRPGYRQHHGQAHPEMPACDGEDCECIGPKKPDGRKP